MCGLIDGKESIGVYDRQPVANTLNKIREKKKTGQMTK